MNPSGNQNPNQFTQNNSPRRGGNVYANQGGNQIIHTGPAKRGGGDTKALLVTLGSDAVFFLYGMLSYTGQNSSGDEWRAGIFIVLLVVTAGMIRRWLRRRV
ncbi:hypothetical protein [Actinoplanes sp. NPDC051411]|uniref:hypothetical protein n=1 Tax=Actinoplanes sp. NPDC051411 TaxID=3155522 RepID=UPI00342177E4